MGVFKLYLSAHVKELPKVISIVENIIANLASDSLEENIFNEAVMRHAAGVVSRWSNPSETAPLLGHSLSRDGVVFDFAGYLNGLEKVSKARAAELASKWLNPVDRLVCLSGSAEELKTLFPNTYQF